MPTFDELQQARKDAIDTFLEANKTLFLPDDMDDVLVGPIHLDWILVLRLEDSGSHRHEGIINITADGVPPTTQVGILTIALENMKNDILFGHGHEEE